MRAHSPEAHQRYRNLRSHHHDVSAGEHRVTPWHDTRLGRESVHRQTARRAAIPESQVPLALEAGGLAAMKSIRLGAAALLVLALAQAQSVTGRWTGPASNVDNGQEI